MKMHHLENIRALLHDQREAILLTSKANRQYATGGCIDEGMCLVTADGCWYFTDSRYLESAQRQLFSAQAVEVDRAHSYSIRIREVLDSRGLHTLGVEEEDLTHGAFLRLQSAQTASLVPCQQELDRLRWEKALWEQEIMRQAQKITDEVFLSLLPVIRVGMTEKELEAELIYRLYRAGAEGLSFPPIVVSGPNTSLPHGVAGDRKLASGDFVTMDFGVKLEGYCSDMTRTVALSTVSEKMRRVYDTVLAAQRAGIAATRAGRTGEEIDGAARAVIEVAGYGAYFGHSYGHSLGLEIHENPNCSPSNDRPIPSGAVISAEPGVYIPGEFGVRIEDVVIVTAQGCEDLTQSPKELIIL